MNFVNTLSAPTIAPAPPTSHTALPERLDALTAHDAPVNASSSSTDCDLWWEVTSAAPREDALVDDWGACGFCYWQCGRTSSTGRQQDVSVLIADDHPYVRSCLRYLLQNSGMHIVGEAQDGEEAVQRCGQLRPQVVVLDITMPNMNGFEAARNILELCPSSKIVFHSAHTCKEYAVEALRVGAFGFVSKRHIACRCLVNAIEAVLEGRTYIASSWTR